MSVKDFWRAAEPLGLENAARGDHWEAANGEAGCMKRLAERLHGGAVGGTVQRGKGLPGSRLNQRRLRSDSGCHGLTLPNDLLPLLLGGTGK